MNSMTGGYSETASGHSTAAFTADPWAVGATSVAVGTDVPDFSTFTFSLDLNKPGVRSYMQEALSTGAVGFFLSSLHSTGIMGAGGGYPRWITKEASGLVAASKLPQLVIDYELLPPVAGDYNEDGNVDGADYVLWRNGGPLLNQVDNPDEVNYQDYVGWRARVGNTVVGGGGASAGQLVPEPVTATFLVQACMLIVLAHRQRNV
jgi:hypothetical protein